MGAGGSCLSFPKCISCLGKGPGILKGIQTDINSLCVLKSRKLQSMWISFPSLMIYDSRAENIINFIFSVVQMTNASLTNAKDGAISEEMVENISDYKTARWWTSCWKVQRIWLWNCACTLPLCSKNLICSVHCLYIKCFTMYKNKKQICTTYILHNLCMIFLRKSLCWSVKRNTFVWSRQRLTRDIYLRRKNR